MQAQQPQSEAAHYDRAPIAEALIDIQVELPDGVGLTDLEGIHRRLRTDYPNRRNLMTVESEISTVAGISASASQHQVGYAFVSQNTKQIVQYRLNGFAFSRLAPYDRWETFSGEAKRLWSQYRRIAKPERITRVAVKYTNRLELPRPPGDFRDYLRTLPDVSTALPQAVSGFFMRLQIPLVDISCMLVLTEAMLPEQSDESVPILLDIDIFRTYDVPYDDESLWAFLEALRLRKNQVFEGCITERVKELIG